MIFCQFKVQFIKSRVQQYVCVSDDTLFNVMIINALTAEYHFRKDMHSPPNSNTCILFQFNFQKLTTLKFYYFRGSLQFTKMATKNYLLVAAIDFGTTYSGYAYSSREDFEKERTKAYLKQWVDPGSSMMYNKTSTCILFDESVNFSKFGFEAESKYQDLIMDNEHKTWYFFRRFKMTLYDKQVRHTGDYT